MVKRHDQEPKNKIGGGWGGNVKQTRIRSGKKLKMEPDSEAVLKFIGLKDISDKMGLPPEEGPVNYAIFSDGLTIVNLPYGYAFSESKFEPGMWYYMLHAGEIEMPGGHNPLKDYEIIELGKDGDIVPCPEKVSESGTIELSSDRIALVNYTRLNYPLRNPKDVPIKG